MTVPSVRPQPNEDVPIVLPGERCLLRAFHPGELDALVAARVADGAFPREEADPQARPRLREQLRRRIERSGRLWDGWLEFAIEADGRLAGDVQARSGRRMLPPGVWELGIELYGDELRGRGIGTEATALLTSHLFRDRAAGRVQATTDVTNEAMRGVLRRLGFTEEGVLRAFMPAGSDPGAARHDYLMIAVTAGDWAQRG